MSGTLQGDYLQANTYTPGNQTPTDVLLQPDGSFVVVWNSADQDGSGMGVYAARFLDASVMSGGSLATDADDDATEGETLLSQVNELTVRFCAGQAPREALPVRAAPSIRRIGS